MSIKSKYEIAVVNYGSNSNTNPQKYYPNVVPDINPFLTPENIRKYGGNIPYVSTGLDVVDFLVDGAKSILRKKGISDYEPLPSSDITPSAPDSTPYNPKPLSGELSLNRILRDSSEQSLEIAKNINEGNVLVATVLYEGFQALRDSSSEIVTVLAGIANEMALSNEIRGAFESANLDNFNNSLEWEGYKFSKMEEGATLTTIHSQNALDTTIAYNELTLENQLKLNSTLEDLVSVTARTRDELALVTKKLDYYTKETTEIQLENFGNDIPALSPQMYRAHKDAVVAKKNSDENTFELDDDDYNSIFKMPDLSELLKYPRITEYLKEVAP
ncbi:hypothetical protein [Sulfurimonas sp.]|uniref:hypothetical protein n=1 Tax=Sulfurimonas sp. TaxID=2022749 RepID=UPI002630B657|nr:hypothetical protein [Sulfurimonas sp.]MDD5156871.1 hypothetical protein [Sulfurimonas sp.]